MMNKQYCIFILDLVIGISVFGIHESCKGSLRDGFAFSGVDGRLKTADSNDKWLFNVGSDLSDGEGTVRAGTELELLPSAGLQKIIAGVSPGAEVNFRLWGRVTKYRGRNFIFADYSLPIAEVNEPKLREPESQQQVPAINDPNDPLIIPQEIIDKLKPVKIVRVKELSKGLELKKDFTLADRTGFIAQKNGRFVFNFDAVGRSIQDVSIPLLRCQSLELAQRRQSGALDNVRFKVAGIITRYRDSHYLLLQRARPVYSHGNFGR